MSPFVKQGRYIDFGFEPCSNAFFDFYVNPKYIDPPLLDIQDVGFFLFLRKNVNPKNPKWKMPSMRQMKRRLGMGWGRIDATMKRLECAGLLAKESGVGQGEKGENIPNDYILSDPLPTLSDFLFAFKDRLKPEWVAYLATLDPVPEMGTPPTLPVPETGTPDVSEMGTLKQTSEEQTVWDLVLETLKLQLSPTTFSTFIEDSKLLHIRDGVATVQVSPRAKDWVEVRLSRQIKQLISMEHEVNQVIFV